MSVKKWWDKFLVTLGYIFIGVLSAMIGFLALRKRKVDYEGMEPGDIVDSLSNADDVRRAIEDFGTAERTNGEPGIRADANTGELDNESPSGRNGILARWVGKAKRVGMGGTSTVMRASRSGSSERADEGD